MPKAKPTSNRRLPKPVVAASTKNSWPPVPVSPTSPTPTARSIVHSLGFKKMSLASGSQSPLSQASQAQSDSLLVSGSPQPDFDNDSVPIDIDDDVIEVEDDEDGVEAGSKRKLTSAVCKEFKRVRFNGEVRAKCTYCFKQLSATSTRSLR
ncbi:hypothetical protein E2562_030739 [Oryza meyeriana var. granulata]|uniref:BED-type domain-containing protein n=1 Tax=Oryza meyeriana var. granulata TaxID=110450 RepID=A0A6G1E3F8_9ORYZ|nr:hypothetical protein E2562_030739 [Oryza meyeriana var. granulata]